MHGELGCSNKDDNDYIHAVKSETFKALETFTGGVITPPAGFYQQFVSIKELSEMSELFFTSI